MRKFVYVVLALCGALAFANPAQAAGPAVLTTGSVGGPNVAVGDVLKSGLKAATTATFPPSITCTSAGLTTTVNSNPPAGGVAQLSVTAMTFSGCTSTASGVTCVQSVAVGGLPLSMTIAASGVSLGTIRLTIRFCTA